MRKLLIAGFLLTFSVGFAGSAKAQENRGFEVAGNYQFLRFNPGNGADGLNCHGGSGSGAAYLTSRLGIVGEFGACKTTGLPSGVSAHQLNYLFGPRMYFPTSHGRVFPFVQALFGGSQFSTSISGFGSASDSALAMAFGGGADVTLSKHVSLRAAQFDYLYTHFGGEGQNNFRIQSGIVYRFGR
jgi:opacity protein-like surface antigen